MTNYDNKFYDDGRQYFESGLPAWREFVLNSLKAISIADFGCGQGDWLEPLKNDISVWGCDGFADVEKLRISKADFKHISFDTATTSDITCGNRDVVMSLEVMEHVSYMHEGNFLENLLSPNPRLVVLGVASGKGSYDSKKFRVDEKTSEIIPGGPLWIPQNGRNHINCQPVNVVIEKMKKKGYEVDVELSDEFRSLEMLGAEGFKRHAFAPFYHKNTRIYKRS